MRNLHQIDQYRDYSPRTLQLLGPKGGNHGNGFFHVPTEDHKYLLRVMASDGMGWDHVSVSLPDRCPNWDEMSLVHRMFFKPTEEAMQLHVPVKDHVCHHPYCLHLWRPQGPKIPRPPSVLVGAPNEENKELIKMLGWE